MACRQIDEIISGPFYCFVYKNRGMKWNINKQTSNDLTLLLERLLGASNKSFSHLFSVKFLVGSTSQWLIIQYNSRHLYVRYLIGCGLNKIRNEAIKVTLIGDNHVIKCESLRIVGNVRASNLMVRQDFESDLDMADEGRWSSYLAFSMSEFLKN